MKSVLAAVAAAVVASAAVLAASAPASADETAHEAVQTAPGVIKLPPRTIYGRPDRPLVVIDIRPLSAAAAAGAAHETLRTSLVNQSQPPAMR